jgi:hypothetical protein
MRAADREGLPASLTRRELLLAVDGRSERVGGAEALKELARRRAAGRAEVFGRVVADEALPAELRAVAAVELGKEQPTTANQEALLRALPSRDRSVTRRAAEALGRIGDERALAALKGVRSRAAPVRRSVSFAKSLIAYRLGLREQLLELPDRGQLLPVQRRRAVPLEVWQETPALLKRIAPTLRREVPAVPLAREGALAFSCGGNRFLVILHREVRSADRLAELAQRSAVAGVVLKRSPSLDRYSLLEYLLAHPAGDGELHLFGVRTTGVVAHYGRARPERAGAAFELRALRTPHSPPLAVEGRYDAAARRLELEVALIYPRLTESQRSKARPESLTLRRP